MHPEDHSSPRTIDTWSTKLSNARWLVVDRNGCEVADCGDRRDDAELIVHYSRTHARLLGALRAALPYLEATYENLQSFGMEFDDAQRTLQRASSALRYVAAQAGPAGSD